MIRALKCYFPQLMVWKGKDLVLFKGQATENLTMFQRVYRQQKLDFFFNVLFLSLIFVLFLG